MAGWRDAPLASADDANQYLAATGAGAWQSAPVATPLDAALQLEGTTGRTADLARSIYQQESSSGRNTGTSNAGAVGGMQVMPATFGGVADPGWNINDPVDNARAGVRYTAQMMDKAGGDPQLAAAGYYGGPGAIAKARAGVAVADPRNPNAPTTLQYAQQVAGRLPPAWQSAPVVEQSGDSSASPGAYHVTITGTSADEPQGQSGGASGSWTPQPNAADGGVLGGLMMGLRDPFDAGAQMLRRAVPNGVGNAIDAFGNKLADLGVPIARSSGVAGVDSLINNANQQYDADRAAAGRDGFDWMRLAGNVAATTPLLAAMPSAGGAGLLGRIGIGAAQGTAAGLLTPVIGDQQSDFAAAKRNQGLLGAVGGAIATPIASALGRIVSPVASRAGSAANLLQNEGVQLTPGQAAGGVFQTVEDKLMSAPILGDAIRAARTRANESLNRAVYNRVLAPIGESTDKIGREAVADAQNKIGAFYDKTLSGVSLVPDAHLLSDVNAITQRVAGMTPTEATALRGIVNRDVIEPLTGVQTIDGPTFKTIESQLTQTIKRYGGSPDAHQQEVGDALSDIQSALRSALQRQNPKQAPMLKAANTAYANLVRLEGAAGKQGAHEGVFTAPQLANAVRQGDASVRKRGYAAGNALMQDLSDAAQSRMSTVIPNSGTTDRLLLNLGALGSGAYNPMIPGGLLAASVPYLPGISRMSTGLITRRPAGAAATAAMLRNLPVGLLGGAAAAK